MSLAHTFAGGALAAAAVTGILLTTASPASAALQGERIRGTWVVNENANPSNYSAITVAADGAITTVRGLTRDAARSTATLANFPDYGSTGPVMADGKCITSQGLRKPVTLEACDPDNPAQLFAMSGFGEGRGGVESLSEGEIGYYLDIAQLDVFTPDGGRHLEWTLTISSSDYPPALDLLDLTNQVPVDCTAARTSTVRDVDDSARSALIGGTALANETLTVTGGPGGPVIARADASGEWSATVADLAVGENRLTVASGEGCAPADLSVTIQPLEIPLLHPAFAGAGLAGVALFALGVFLRRRKQSGLSTV